MTLIVLRYAMEKGDVLHRGFLSLYQRTAQVGKKEKDIWGEDEYSFVGIGIVDSLLVCR